MLAILCSFRCTILTLAILSCLLMLCTYLGSSPQWVSSCPLRVLTQVLLSENLNYSWATSDRSSQISHQTGNIVKRCWIFCFQMQNKMIPVSFTTLTIEAYRQDARRLTMNVFLSLRELSSYVCYAGGVPKPSGWWGGGSIFPPMKLWCSAFLPHMDSFQDTVGDKTTLWAESNRISSLYSAVFDVSLRHLILKNRHRGVNVLLLQFCFFFVKSLIFKLVFYF